MYIAESELQRMVVAGLNEGRFEEIFGKDREVDQWPGWRKYYRPDFYLQDIPDVVVTTRSTIYVVELKRPGITWNHLQQLGRYLRTHATLYPSSRKRVRGILIGHHRARTATDEAIVTLSEEHGPIRMLAYTLGSDGHVGLTDVAPVWVGGAWRRASRTIRSLPRNA